MKSGRMPAEIDGNLQSPGKPRNLELVTGIIESPETTTGCKQIHVKGRTVTFSRNVTIPLTRLCRNHCGYCGYRRQSGGYLRWKDIMPLLERAVELGCCEALLMSGERPELVHPKAMKFLSEEGFNSTPDYAAWLCGRILDETDLLPHSNLGVLDPDELSHLREVNASMGLMLEDASPRLCGEGMPHHGSPGKNPEVRLETIKEAGRQKIPFTTGLLIGIGQTSTEVARSLILIRELQDLYGNIQEVIIQRFMPKRGTEMALISPPPTRLMLNVVSAARIILGREMNIQVPPNIEREFERFIKMGANDLGGISPITPDEINPEETWCSEDEIFKRISSIGYRAELRPPVYREYLRREYLEPRILERAKSWFKRFEVDPNFGEF